MNQPLAYIHPQAKIAENVIIEPFATIAKNVEIGEGSWIGPNVSIMEGARIGKNCRIFPGAVIAAVPQDLKFAGEETLAIIGDNTTVREFVTVNRGTKTKGQTVVGKNCLLMAYTHVAHDCLIGNNVILVNCVQLAGEVHIDDWAILSGSTLVHQFVSIGKHVMITGGSKVRKDVPPFVKAGRDPLAYAGLNSVGLRRRSFTNESIHIIQNIYRLLYQSGYNTTEALEVIEREIQPSPERDEIVNFVKKATRGIIKGYTGDNNDADID
jgi:UDP-N-acetylglucosamine acyltransferase